jgi:hypothetical protein
MFSSYLVSWQSLPSYGLHQGAFLLPPAHIVLLFSYEESLACCGNYSCLSGLHSTKVLQKSMELGLQFVPLGGWAGSLQSPVVHPTKLKGMCLWSGKSGSDDTLCLWISLTGSLKYRVRLCYSVPSLSEKGELFSLIQYFWIHRCLVLQECHAPTLAVQFLLSE